MYAISAAEIWFIIGIVLFIAELGYPTFVCMFFGIGAWVTALGLYLGYVHDLTIQSIIFCAVSIISLILFRLSGKPIARGDVNRVPQQELDPLINSIGKVIEDIPAGGGFGKVEVHGTNWQASSDLAIEKGRSIKVVRSTNLTLHVEPLE